MATDDVHDLFDRDEDDSAEDAGADERSGESAEWAAEVDFPSYEDDDSPDGSTPEETEGSTAEPTGRSDDDGFGEFETPESTTTPDERPRDALGETESGETTTPPGTAASDRSLGDDAGAFEPAEASSMEAFGDEADGPDPSTSTTADPERATDPEPASDDEPAPEDGPDGFEPAEASSSTAGQGDDREGESPGRDPAATPEWEAEGGASEPQPAVSSTDSTDNVGEDVDSGTVEDGVDGGEPAESRASSVGETAGDDPDEPGPAEDSGSAEDAGSTEGADPATSAVDPGDAAGEEREGSAQGEPTAHTEEAAVGGQDAHGSTAASTDGSTATDRDDPETANPDELGSVTSGTAADEGVAASPSGSNRLPTGIDELDRAMGGGVPPGRLVLLVADPGVQSELIVDSVLSQRDTLYVTTDRPDWEVTKDIEPGLGTGEVKIREHNPDSLLSGVDSLLDELGTSSNFVLDSVNELELVPRQRYRVFLSDVKRRLFDTGSVGLLTGVTVGHESARDLTLRRADVVWRLETSISDREVENRLYVPKFRGGAAVTETIKLELTDEVRVETG